jgi:predicted ATP-dependent protease
MAERHGLEGVTDGAVARLLAIAARWAERRDRLTARIELLDDLICEAAVYSHASAQKILSEDAVTASYDSRRRRNARVEEHMRQSIVEGMMMIDTVGSAVGQINALTVSTVGDHRFGMPVRVTARSFVGRAGIVNIERDVGIGGPIQQKGTKVLEGYLAGRLAQTRPLSFTCSITFEQLYGGVEGDSASMSELIAVLSDLAQLPIRQDLAITGSVNQGGLAQAIGGVHWKVDGFYRLCATRPGGLTGTQGVIVPASNCVNLVLPDDVAAAIEAGNFHLWSVTNVDDVVALMLGVPAGQPDAMGNYAPDTLFGRIAARLDVFDRILAERNGGSA